MNLTDEELKDLTSNEVEEQVKKVRAKMLETGIWFCAIILFGVVIIAAGILIIK